MSTVFGLRRGPPAGTVEAVKVTIVESSYDCGVHDQRMGAGPAHLIRSGLADDLAAAGHEVEHTRLDLGPGLHAEIGAAIELARRIAGVTSATVENDRFPVVLSGNCNGAVGAVTGIGARGTAVLWFDAHADFNTPATSPSGNLHGMPVAVVMGLGPESLTSLGPEIDSEAVTQIDRERKIVVSAGGETAYDKLIVATGSAPFIIPVPGRDLPGVMAFRVLDDVLAI